MCDTVKREKKTKSEDRSEKSDVVNSLNLDMWWTTPVTAPSLPHTAHLTALAGTAAAQLTQTPQTQHCYLRQIEQHFFRPKHKINRASE